MGAILQKEGRFDEALTYYKQAEALDPSNINTRINVGTLYQQKGDYRTAIKAYESVLILYPNNVNANYYRAQCYDKLGDNKIAQEAYKKVIALDPNMGNVIKRTNGSKCQKTTSPQQFVEYVNTNLADANPSSYLYDYAIELHKDGKIDNAIYMYQQAIKSNGSNPEMYVNLALAQAQGNDFDNALSTLQTAQAKFPKAKNIADTTKNISEMKTNNLITKAADYYNKKDYKKQFQYTKV